MKLPDGYAVYDSADYIHNAEDAALYLQAAIEDDPTDVAFITQALGVVARSGNLSELARQIGVTREGLYKSLSEAGNPSFATVVKLLNALGLRLSVEPLAA